MEGGGTSTLYKPNFPTERTFHRSLRGCPRMRSCGQGGVRAESHLPRSAAPTVLPHHLRRPRVGLPFVSRACVHTLVGGWKSGKGKWKKLCNCD